jgi:hypothetical protein
MFDVFSEDIPSGLPPLRGIEHQIDLVPRASIPNRLAYRSDPEETTELQTQVDVIRFSLVIRPSKVRFGFWRKKRNSPGLRQQL